MEKNLQDRATEAAELIVRLSGQRTAPIEPMKVAEREKDQLTVIGGAFKKQFDGQLEFHPKKRRFLMFYNDKYDRAGRVGPGQHPRTRFIIGHELGHFYLERHNAYLRNGGRKHGSRGEFSSDYLVEKEADAFASGMLMPRSLMEPLVNECDLSIDRIEELARHFQTSHVSTSIRAVSLCHYPCAMVAIRNGAVAWVARSDSLVEAKIYPPSRGAFTSKSARAQWENFRLGAAERTTATIYAQEWFKVYDRTDLGKLSVTEHFLPVPIMDTLIVLLTIPEDELARVSDFDDTDYQSDDDDEE
jgi:hypothetical protein